MVAALALGLPGARAAVRYRPAATPVVVVARSGGEPYFQVRVRTNRALPTDRQGVRANFLVGTSGSDADAVPFGNRARHCYAAVVGNDVRPDPDLAGARPGSRARLTIRVHGQRQLTRMVTLHSRSYVRRWSLGCGVRDLPVRATDALHGKQ